MPDLLIVWTPGSLAAAIAGGVGLGLVLSRTDDRRYSLWAGFVLFCAIGSVFQLVFWSGQLIDTLANEGPGNALRVVSRFLLSLVYVGAMGGGGTLGSWHNRRVRPLVPPIEHPP